MHTCCTRLLMTRQIEQWFRQRALSTLEHVCSLTAHTWHTGVDVDDSDGLGHAHVWHTCWQLLTQGYAFLHVTLLGMTWQLTRHRDPGVHVLGWFGKQTCLYKMQIELSKGLWWLMLGQLTISHWHTGLTWWHTCWQLLTRLQAVHDSISRDMFSCLHKVDMATENYTHADKAMRDTTCWQLLNTRLCT